MGNFGLSIFFLLSAYLIVTLLLQEQERTGTINIKAFAARRALRIWPLYLLALAINVSFAGLPGLFVTRMGMITMLFFCANFYLASTRHILGIMTPLWSLSIEEQFYVVIPWFARNRDRKLLILCLVALIASYVTLTVQGLRHEDYIWGVWFNNLIQFQFFGAGGLLAIWHRRHANSLSMATRSLLFGTAACFWYLAVSRCSIHDTGQSTPARLLIGYALLLIGTVLIFLGFLELPIRVPRAVTYLGRISYGLYVFNPIAVQATMYGWVVRKIPRHGTVLTVLLCFALTTLMASVSYQAFERPILRLKRRFEPI